MTNTPTTDSRVSDDDTEATWRDLALQFDGHRIDALSQLKYAVRCIEEYATVRDILREPLQTLKTFLAAPPLPGEKVLAERITALSRRSLDDGVEPVAWRYSSTPGPDGWTVTTGRELAYREHDNRNLVEPLYASRPTRNAGVGVKALEWVDNTKGPRCPIRFAAWPLHGYRIHLYQWGEADQWAVSFGSAGGVMLPSRYDADAAKAAVETEWASYLNRAALSSKGA